MLPLIRHSDDDHPFSLCSVDILVSLKTVNGVQVSECARMNVWPGLERVKRAVSQKSVYEKTRA